MVQGKRFRYRISIKFFFVSITAISFHIYRFDYHHFKRSMTIAGQAIAFLGVLCLPMIRLAFLIVTFILLNFSFYLRKFYVRLLTVVFDYATKIKKDKEIVIDGNVYSIESSMLSPSTFKSFDRLSPLYRQSSIAEGFESDDGIGSDKSPLSTSELSSRRSRLASEDDIQFNLGKT